LSIVAIPSSSRRGIVPAVAPEAAEDLARLESLRNQGWEDLTDLTAEELQNIDACIDAVSKGRSLQEREITSHTSTVLREAEEAVRDERRRRNLEHERLVDLQRKRVEYIHRAASLVRDAGRYLDMAEGIPDRRGELLPRHEVGGIDPEGLTDVELGRIVAEDGRDAEALERHAEDMQQVAARLLAVRDPRFKAHAKTAKAIADEASEDAAKHRARAEVASVELSRRDLRARMEREANEPAKVSDVQALVARVAELELALSVASK